MPVNPTFPGVYIEEIPSGVRTITGVATSITAFVGRALRGPTSDDTDKNNRAITINSYADFERIYGGLWVGSTLGYAVRDFFLNGGSQAVIARLFQPTFASDAERTAAQTAADAVATAATGNDAAAAAKAADDAAAKEQQSKDPDAAKKVASAVAQAADAAAVLPDAKPETVQRAAKRAAVQSMAPDATAFSFACKDPVNNAGQNPGISLVAAYPGSWGQYLRATVDFNTSPDMAAALGVNPGDLFNLTVREETTNGRAEQFLNLTLKDSVRRIDTVLASDSKLVQWDSTVKLSDAQANFAGAYAAYIAAQQALSKTPNDPTAQKNWKTVQQNFEDGVTVAEGVLSDARQALVQAKKSNSGVAAAQQAVLQAQQALEDAQDAMLASDGGVLTEDDFVGQGRDAAQTGLFALEQVDLFNILCIPPYLSGTNGMDVDPDLISQAAAYCEQRRAMLLVDPPSGWVDKDTAKAQFLDASNDVIGTRSQNAALFFPRLKEVDPLRNNQIGTFVPCGAVAGIFARTDTQRGVWKAPAGLDASLVGVPQLAINLTNAENGELNPLGINCLRAFPASGRVVWGSRTLQGNDNLASEWKYIPVRRTALFIEESLYRGTQWVVFEPNDEPLWAQIRLNVGAFMQNLFRQGAFQGQTPKDAYFVKCDKETTTQNDINLGIVNIVVGFAPLKPAEFVIIKLQQMAGQVQS
jgi:phage tail sheath protein FI